MKRFAVALLTGSIAMMLAVGPVFASCECAVLAQSRWFTLDWYDTCTSDLFGSRLMYDRLAHAVAVAASSWEMVGADSSLRASLASGPIELYYSRGGIEEAPPQWKGRSTGMHPDSIVARFQKAYLPQVATLYSIRLGSFSSERIAKRAYSRWPFPHRRFETGPVVEPAMRDSLLSVSWQHASCAGTWLADLFILPPGKSPSGRYDLCFRLLIDAGDAKRIRSLLARRLHLTPPIIRVRTTGEVLRIAIAE